MCNHDSGIPIVLSVDLENVKHTASLAGAGVHMAKEVACTTDSFRVRAETDDELVSHVKQHAMEAHQRDLSRDQVLSMAKTVQIATL